MRHPVLTRSGMTLLEVVMALMVLVLLQPILITAITISSKTDFQWTQRQNQLGILQLRRKIALGVKMKISPTMLQLTINDQRISLECHEGMILQQPGAMPYLFGLSSCAWSRRDDLVVLSFSEEGISHEIIVGLWT